MTAWSALRSMSWATRAVIALGLFAVLLVAAVPAAFVVGVAMMLFGHVVGGLALFGAAILAAVASVMIASVSGVRHLRKVVTQRVSQRAFPVVQLNRGDYRCN